MNKREAKREAYTHAVNAIGAEIEMLRQAPQLFSLGEAESKKVSDALGALMLEIDARKKLPSGQRARRKREHAAQHQADLEKLAAWQRAAAQEVI